MADKQLTPKQALFVEAYVENGGNGTKAAMAAGYSPRCCHVQAYENIRKPDVWAAILAKWPEAVRIAKKKSRAKGQDMVYVVKARGMNVYKIGTTRRGIKVRLAALQIGSPVKLFCVASFPGGAEVEQKIHRHFQSQRLHGEWFALNSEDLSLIQEAKRWAP